MINIKNIRELGIKQGFLAEGKKGIDNLLSVFKRFMKLLNIPFYDECCPDIEIPLPVGYTEADGVVRYNPTTKEYEVVSSSSGDFIPLSGTEVGKPVTGDIEVPFDNFIGLVYKDSNLRFGMIISDAPTLLYDESLSGGNIVTARLTPSSLILNAAGPTPFTGIAATSIYENKGLNNFAQMQDISVAISYSTTEQLTGGTWIDGKPIYRRVFTGNLNSFGARTVNTSSFNLERMLPTSFCQIDNNLKQQNVPFSNTNFNANFAYSTEDEWVEIQLNATPGPVEDMIPYVLLLEYTKTTD
jgi:hypothetical protein